LSAPAALDIVSHGAEQTRRLGSYLGALLGPGDVVLLEGEFGTGKTTLTQGLAAGLGINARYVNSPTFTLINEHRGGRVPLYHIDLYRLEDEESVATLGLDDYFEGDGVTVIEWPGQAAPWLPEEYILVRLSHLNETKRTLRFHSRGDRYAALLDRFRRETYG
jgi:tRNA threonylcarbamoyladenosine biosynthesis protein TsaE